MIHVFCSSMISVPRASRKSCFVVGGGVHREGYSRQSTAACTAVAPGVIFGMHAVWTGSVSGPRNANYFTWVPEDDDIGDSKMCPTPTVLQYGAQPNVQGAHTLEARAWWTHYTSHSTHEGSVGKL